MPAGLQDVFEARRRELQRRGWATPPGATTQHEQKAWLYYWAALERKAVREGWLPQPPVNGLTEP